MTTHELKERTKRFAIEVLKLGECIPKTLPGKAVASQVIRAATSVGANYRAACRARSRAEFISKIGIVEEEADETAFWLEIVRDSGLLSTRVVEQLHQEADELTRIMVASGRTAKPRVR